MHAQHIEPALILHTTHLQTASLALHGGEGNPGHLIDDEAKSAGEQMRLLLSWHAVLGDIRQSEAGAFQW
jgi:hypothetical protein